MNIDQMIEVLQAAKEGKTIQYCYYKEEWHDLGKTGAFNFGSDITYRVKPAEKKLVPHYFALFKDADGCYRSSEGLHTHGDVDCLLEAYPDSFVRLLTEYPPIMLEVEDA